MGWEVKIALSCQSKYGLIESSAKIGFFLLEGHRSGFLGQEHKSVIWDETPPCLHINSSLYVCRRVQGS